MSDTHSNKRRTAVRNTRLAPIEKLWKAVLKRSSRRTLEVSIEGSMEGTIGYLLLFFYDEQQYAAYSNRHSYRKTLFIGS